MNISITVDSICKKYLTHHVIWAWMKGYVPKGIDHRDLNPSNNKWLNLREADKSQNGCNRKNPINNQSGQKGVCWDNERQKWLAYARFNRKTHLFERFDRLDDAINARVAKTKELHGEFFREAA